jgi:hypothetical protein
VANVAEAKPAGQPRPGLTVTPTVLPPAITHPAPEIRRETSLPPKSPAAPVLAVSTAATVAGR